MALSELRIPYALAAARRNDRGAHSWILNVNVNGMAARARAGPGRSRIPVGTRWSGSARADSARARVGRATVVDHGLHLSRGECSRDVFPRRSIAIGSNRGVREPRDALIQPAPGRPAYRRQAYPIPKTTTPQRIAPPSEKPAEAPVAKEITTQISAAMAAERRLLEIIGHTLPLPAVP